MEGFAGDEKWPYSASSVFLEMVSPLYCLREHILQCVSSNKKARTLADPRQAPLVGGDLRTTTGTQGCIVINEAADDLKLGMRIMSIGRNAFPHELARISHKCVCVEGDQFPVTRAGSQLERFDLLFNSICSGMGSDTITHYQTFCSPI